MDRDFNEETTPYSGKQSLKKSWSSDNDSPRIRFTLSPKRSIRNSIFDYKDTPNSTRNKIDVNKTFQLISKHLIPSQLIRSNSSKSGKHETESLKRKSDEQDNDKFVKRKSKDKVLLNEYVLTPKSSCSKENKSNSICSLVEAYKSSKQNNEASSYNIPFLKSKCVAQYGNKSSSVDVNANRFSKYRKADRELFSSYIPYLKSINSLVSKSCETSADSNKFLKKRKRDSDEPSTDKYFKKSKCSGDKETKSPSTTFNLSQRCSQSYKGNKILELDYSSNSDSFYSPINASNSSFRNWRYKETNSPSAQLSYSANNETKKESPGKRVIFSYEDNEKLFSRRKSSCKSINSENSGSSSSHKGFWEVSPDNIKKKKLEKSTYNYSCNSSPWEVSTDVSYNNSSPSSVLTKKKGTRRVSLSTSSSHLDVRHAQSVVKKIKQESNASDFGDLMYRDNDDYVFNNSFSENEKSSSFVNLSSSKRSSSSIVVYDECSSEEEMGWNGDYGTKKTNDSLLSPGNITHSKTSFTKTSDSDNSFSKSEEFVDNADSSTAKETQMKSRILGRILRKKLYTFPLDLDTISNEIDLRVLGRHDDWINSKKRNIFILGDSHTRFLVNGMKHILPGFKIFTFCKPSAKTEQVFSGLDKSISELTESDFLILFCGTNDMWSESTYPAERCMAKKLENIKNTNILLCNVPKNYSESSSSYVQKNIKKFNGFLKETSRKFNNIKVVNLNKLKRTIFFTKHGLHFNGIGKVKICEILSHKLIDVLDKINPIESNS